MNVILKMLGITVLTGILIFMGGCTLLLGSCVHHMGEFDPDTPTYEYERDLEQDY